MLVLSRENVTNDSIKSFEFIIQNCPIFCYYMELLSKEIYFLRSKTRQQLQPKLVSLTSNNS